MVFRPYALTYAFYVSTRICYHWIGLQPKTVCFLEMHMWILSVCFLPGSSQFVGNDTWNYCMCLLPWTADSMTALPKILLNEWLHAQFIRDCMELSVLDQIKSFLHPTPLQSTLDLAFAKISLLKDTFSNHSSFGELILNQSFLPAAMKNLPKPSCLLSTEPRDWKLSQLYILLYSLGFFPK